MPDGYLIGIDLGATKIIAGAVTTSGEIISSYRIPTNVSGGFPGVKSQLIDVLQQIKSDQSLLKLQGIGLGVPGQIDAKTGAVIFAPNLQWHHVPLKKEMEDAFQVPVSILNDVRAITFGEWLFGAGKGSSNVFCMFIGTGIGGGMIYEDRLMLGADNSFGEVGHTPINFLGPTCTCGTRGCLEAYAGGWGIAKRAQEKIQADRSLGKGILKFTAENIETIEAKQVFQAFKENDPLAKEIIEQATKALISGCIGIVNLMNPSTLILGGGILDGYPELFQTLKKGIEDGALKASTRFLKILPATLGQYSGVLGAAGMVLYDQTRKDIHDETFRI